MDEMKPQADAGEFWAVLGTTLATVLLVLAVFV
jgi:hypothetical protein